MFFYLIRQPFILLGLSIRDMWHERVYSLTVALVITLLLLPAFLLFAVRRATVETYTRFIKDDPKSLEIVTDATSFKFDEAKVNALRQWTGADEQPLVQSVIQYTNDLISSVPVRAAGGEKTVEADLIPSNETDSLIWSKDELANPIVDREGESWVVITQSLAAGLGVSAGDSLSVGISIPPNDEFEVNISLKIAKVLQPRISAESEIYIPHQLASQIMHWWNGYAIGTRRWPHTKRVTKGLFDGLLAAISGETIQRLDLRRLRTDMNVKIAPLKAADLLSRFGIVNQSPDQIEFHLISFGQPLSFDDGKFIKEEFDAKVRSSVWSSLFADLPAGKIQDEHNPTLKWIALDLMNRPEATFGFLLSQGQRLPPDPLGGGGKGMLFGESLLFGRLEKAPASSPPSQDAVTKTQVTGLMAIGDQMNVTALAPGENNPAPPAKVELLREISQVRLSTPVDELKPNQEVEVYLEIWVPATQVSENGTVQQGTEKGPLRAQLDDKGKPNDRAWVLVYLPCGGEVIKKGEGNSSLVKLRSIVRYQPSLYKAVQEEVKQSPPPSATVPKLLPEFTGFSPFKTTITLEGISNYSLPLNLSNASVKPRPALAYLSVEPASKLRALTSGRADYISEFDLIQDKPPAASGRLRIYASSIESVVPLVDRLGQEFGIQCTSMYQQIQRIDATDRAIRKVSWILLIVVGVAGGLAILFGIMVNVEKRLPSLSLLRLVGLGGVGWIPFLQASFLAISGYGMALGLYFTFRGQIGSTLQLERLFEVNPGFINDMAHVSRLEFMQVAAALFAISTLGAAIGVIRVYLSAKPADGFKQH